MSSDCNGGNRASSMALVSRVFLAVLALAVAGEALAKMYEEPRSFTLSDKALDSVDRKTLKAIDRQRLLAEDRDRGKNAPRPGPLRFAVAEDVAFDLSNSGTWQDLPDGRLWRLRIHSPGAVSHNLGITRFDLPEGAKLWIYNPSGKHVEGPYTSRNRSRAGSLWTPMIDGDEIVVELFVAKGAAQPALTIGKVNKGYRGFGKVGLFGDAEGPCNIDVVCPEGNPWPNPIRAVTVYTINGTGACTGTLMNNTALDFRPFVLSANHCGVTTTSDVTIAAFWNFQSAVCGTHGPGPLTDTQTGGATFRATSAASDFVLFELDANPDDLGFNVFHAGWDRSGVAPPGVAGIHHPRADVKAISFANTPPMSVTNGSSVPNPAGSFWRPTWDVNGPGGVVAVTEQGSSGSCIFASDTQRCIGQLSNGPSFCGAPAGSLHDFYGKFSVDWVGGGTNATRLSNWLDPVPTGALGLDGDPHITTLDGINYDFQGAGEFVALRDATGAEIQARQAAIATTFTPTDPYDGLSPCVSLNTAVAARVGKRRVTYQPNLSGVPDPSGLQLRVDGHLTTLTPGGIDLGDGGRIAPTAAPGGLEITFPDRYALYVTPGWWASQSKWYLNIDAVRTGPADGLSGVASGGPPTGGLVGAIPRGSWLPTLPDGSSMGPMPPALHDRYVDLYQKFGEAWRVTGKASLFDYAPGTSTETFTIKTWPMEKPPCDLPDATPVRPLPLRVAVQACRGITDLKRRANCVADVRTTGEVGFAKTYLLSQRVVGSSTTVAVRGDKDPTKYGEPVTFTAIVIGRARGKGVPTGTVQFTVDGEKVGAPIPLLRGRATWKTAQLKAGPHKIAAAYIPRPGTPFSPSTSTVEPHTVTATN